MKKAKNRMSKLLKITLLLCMIFVEIANPIKVFADVIDPTYSLEINLDTINNEIDLISNGTKELVPSDTYIVEVIRSFKYVNGSIYEDENEKEYTLELGSSLTSGISLLHKTFTYNGTSYVNVNIYEIKNNTLDLTGYTNSDYEELLTTEDVEKIVDTSYEEVISDKESGIILSVTGDNVTCLENVCNIANINDDNIVNVDYEVKNGNLDPNEKYYSVLYVNGVAIEANGYNFRFNFNEILNSSYELTYQLKNLNNEVVLESDKVTLEYDLDSEKDIINYFSNNALNNKLFSYTALSEEEKNELGVEYRNLERPIINYLDLLANMFIIDTNFNYSYYDLENNLYSILSGNLLRGSFSEEDTVLKISDLKEIFNNLINDDILGGLFYTLSYKIVDKDNNEIENDKNLENGMKLVVSFYGEEVTYDILVYGDVDGGYVEHSDITSLIDKLLNNNISFYNKLTLDLNEDENLDITDVSLLGADLANKSFTNYDLIPTDVITPIIDKSSNIIRVGDTFDITLSFDGFENNYFNAIDGIIDYNKDLLKITNITVLDEAFVGNYLDNRFMYATDNMFLDNEIQFIKVTFEALNEGTSLVKLNTVLVEDGTEIETNTSNELEIFIDRKLHSDARLNSLTSSYGYFDKAFNPEENEYTLYVDSYINNINLYGTLSDEFATTDGFKNYTLNSYTTKISVSVVAEDGTSNIYNINVIKIYKSSNNNLSNISIDGYEITFDKDKLEYEITVENDVNELNIIALVEDTNAWAKIEGNENFSEGINKVTIKVYAEDGTTKTYTILVNKKSAPTSINVDLDDEEEPKENTEKIVISTLIVLVVLGLIYLIFKDDSKSDPVIKQINPDKNNNKNKK